MLSRGTSVVSNSPKLALDVSVFRVSMRSRPVAASMLTRGDSDWQTAPHTSSTSGNSSHSQSPVVASYVPRPVPPLHCPSAHTRESSKGRHLPDTLSRASSESHMSYMIGSHAPFESTLLASRPSLSSKEKNVSHTQIFSAAKKRRFSPWHVQVVAAAGESLVKPHERHSVDAASGWYVPAGHAVQAEEFVCRCSGLTKPGAQGISSELPAGQKRPSRHT